MAKTAAQLESQRKYREKNRDAIREKARVYADRKRRENGTAKHGSPEYWEKLRARPPVLRGAEHPNWKGDDAGYVSLHMWVSRHKTRTGVCSVCGQHREPKPGGFRKVATEWANVSGEYHRDLDDFVEMCTSCHKKHDLAFKRGDS